MAIVGVAISAEILYVHSRIAALGNSYTSFCNVNDSINCDRVLGSAFSTLFGIPIAWFALATYGFIVSCFGIVWKQDPTRESRALGLASIAIAGGTAFSVYMAGVSLFVLKTVCLLCSGLYAVSLALLGIMIALIRSSQKTAIPRAQTGLSLKRFAATGVAAATVVLAVVLVAWPRPESLDANLVSLDDVRNADPEFYRWYLKQPVIQQKFTTRNAVGPKDAAVTIVEFADLQCGHCRKSHAYLEALRARRPDEIRIIYKHFPLDASCNEAVNASVHRQACRAAEAVECAAAQGRFTEMLDALFDHQTRLFDPVIMRLAHESDLDMDEFTACLDSERTRADVVADARVGDKLDIASTPTLYFNGRRIVGSFDSDVDYDYAVLIETGLVRDGD